MILLVVSKILKIAEFLNYEAFNAKKIWGVGAVVEIEGAKFSKRRFNVKRSKDPVGYWWVWN